MRLNHHAYRFLLTAFVLVPSLAIAQDTATEQTAAEVNLAVKPEVQTAAWAQSWWMPRHEEKLEALKAQKKVGLLMIGDSITHGWENKNGKAIWDRYYAPRDAFNIGFSGDRTENVLWRFENGELDGISPELAIVMIGTNNAGHRKEKPEHTAAGIKAIVEQLRERLPQTRVLLLAIFPRGKDANDPLRQLNDATNKIIAKLADNRHVFFLDISDAFLEEDGTLPRSIMPDLLHPNAEGYRIWAEAMEPVICRMIGWVSGIKWPEPKVVDPGPAGEPVPAPSDAIVLFDGKDLSAFKGGDRWIVEDGVATCRGGGITSKQAFGDCQLHIEWAAPAEVKGSGQGRGNSGVYMMGKYELQILDSYENETYHDGQAGSLYKQHPPLVNACRKPGEWQTYDIVFSAPVFEDGEVVKPATMTVLHNGILIQDHFELLGATAWHEAPKYTPHGPEAPFHIQDHGNPVRFRNIWIRELTPYGPVEEGEE